MTQAPPSNDTPENWDAASKGYSEHIAPAMMGPFAGPFLDRLDANENCEALEVAAGSGAFTLEYGKRVKSLVASDFSPKMVDILREKSAGASNVSCRLLDGQALDVPNASFDRVGCFFGLMLFPDRAKGFSEIRRVLRPGGRAAVAGWATADKFETFGLFMSGVKQAFPDLPPPPAPPPIFSLANLETFQAEMEAAGFENVTVEYESQQNEIPDFDKFWAMLTSGAPPILLLLQKIGEDGKEHLRTTLKRMLQEKFGDGPIVATNAATVGTGTVPG